MSDSDRNAIDGPMVEVRYIRLIPHCDKGFNVALRSDLPQGHDGEHYYKLTLTAHGHWLEGLRVEASIDPVE